MADIKTVVDSMKLEELVVVASESVVIEKEELDEIAIKGVVALLRERETNNGYSGIARKSGIPEATVKEIDSVVQARVAELMAGSMEEPVGEVIKP